MCSQIFKLRYTVTRRVGKSHATVYYAVIFCTTVVANTILLIIVDMPDAVTSWTPVERLSCSVWSYIYIIYLVLDQDNRVRHTNFAVETFKGNPSIGNSESSNG